MPPAPMSGLIQPVVNDQGDRVIPGTRRPDGTVRKERRIRPGYTPQDEVQTYQSKGTQAKASIPKCPGMDDAEVEALAQAATRKKGGGGSGGASSGSKPKAPAAAPPTAKPAPAPAPVAVPAPVPPAVDDPPEVVLEKKVRTLRKKLRECDALAAKAAEGKELNAPEAEKLGRAKAWSQEVDDLERQLAALTTGK